jgi:hypothetical protein
LVPGILTKASDTHLIGAVAALLKGAQPDDLFRIRAMVDGRILDRLGEADRQEAFRDDGATSTETWAVERFGIAAPTARAYAHVAERAWDLPHLLDALCEGEISFDKLRALVDVATPATDAELRDRARECTVRELVDIARSTEKPIASPRRSDHDRRFLRFNDQFHTMTVQLPAEFYAETQACIDACTREIPNDGKTPLDQRRCDGFMGMVHSSTAGGSSRATMVSRYVVVVHAPREALVDESGEMTDLAGELERDGLISTETVQQIACDATIAVAVDDDVGHTMYEGRARRFPSDAQRREVMRRDRHCRFPACNNVSFTNVHHIKPWTGR